MKVRDIIGPIISHNEIVSIWEVVYEEANSYHQQLWHGMAHQIPKEYLIRPFSRIFGTIPESISKADTINIEVV